MADEESVVGEIEASWGWGRVLRRVGPNDLAGIVEDKEAVVPPVGHQELVTEKR